jgi:opacity protein-like surface antigen
MKRLLIAAAGAALLATSALAQDAPGQAIGGIVEGLGLRKPPPPAPDFVRESRPAQLDYAPMAPKPDQDPKKRAQALRASGADLDRAAAENRRRAARIKTPD